MAASDYTDTLQKLYVAYFGRPADPAGLDYWTSQADAEQGNLDSIIENFAQSDESTALYGNQSTPEQVTSIYQNLFNRAPEQAGLASWVAQIDSGTITAAQAAYTILNDAQGADADAVNNKVEVAKTFTDKLDTDEHVAGYSGSDAADAARAYLADVDSTDGSLLNAAENLNDAVADASGVDAGGEQGGNDEAFVVNENPDTHALEFSGTATGDVTLSFSETGNQVVFSRDGHDSQAVSLDTVKSIDLPDGTINLNAADADRLAKVNTTDPVKFGDGVTVNVTDIEAQGETEALTAYNTETLGGAKVTLSSADHNWEVSASDLAAASKAGVSFADGEQLVIETSLTQDQVAPLVLGTGLFQSGDTFSFPSDELTGVTGFASATNGTLDLGNGNHAELVVGTGESLVASAAQAAFLFDTKSGTLSYDADGTGSNAAVDVISLTGVTSLTADNFTFNSDNASVPTSLV